MTAPGLLPPDVRAAVEASIGDYPGSPIEQAIEKAGAGALVIKYSPARYAKTILNTGQLHISSALDYTWGTGVYCSLLDNPLSGAIYGRVGSVASFDPTRWKIFDATGGAGQVAYIRWLQLQPLYPLLALTVHAQLANQLMRDHFRTSFRIDCVAFHPDQADTTPAGDTFGAIYTSPSDIWMCAGEFGRRGTLMRGASRIFRDARPCVLVEEEFEKLLEGMVYAPQVGPLGQTPAGGTLAGAVAAAHANHTWVRVPA